MKYLVSIQRYVEQTATVEIEADSIEEAVEEAADCYTDATVEWQVGDEIIPGSAAETDGQCAYWAQTEDGSETWER
jgi:chaperonin cofactor prefoldin